MSVRSPKAVKAFYMKEDPQDERLALGVDVLAPEGYGDHYDAKGEPGGARRVHNTLPRKIPVGRINSTSTRMTKDTANL